MTKYRHLNLALYVRPICLLLCCALAAPHVTLAAALGTPRKVLVSGAAGVTTGGAPQGEVTRPDDPQAQARAEEKLAAAAGGTPLAKSPDERGGAPNRDEADRRTAGKNVSRGSTMKNAPASVLRRVVPAPEKSGAAVTANKPGAETPTLGNILGETPSPVFSVASGAATAPLAGK